MNSKVILSWFPALFCMGVLFWLSSLPGDQIKLPDFTMSDKVVHFLAYAFLGWLIYLRHMIQNWGVKSKPQFSDFKFQLGRLDLWGQLIGIVYGVSDEFHQSFVVLRDCSFLDWTADAFGVAFGSWVARLLLKTYRNSVCISAFTNKG